MNEARAQNAAQIPPSATTWRYDNGRTGQNTAETVLTPANVNQWQFGKLRSYKVDGYVYAQPLYLPKVGMAGGTHNVVFIATEHESVYAFDADHNVQLWAVSLVDTAHGAAAGSTSVPSADLGTSDIVPEVGITATPVIDPAAGTIYVEAKSKENGTYVHRLHALDVTTGAERLGSPVVIAPSIAGTGIGSTGGTIGWQPQWEHERTGLLLLNGKVYMAFASHGDNGPYHGWVLGYDATTLQPAGVYNTAPNGGEGGIWESGAGLAADTLMTGGRMFIVNGNGNTNDGLPYTDAQSYGNAIERLDLSTGVHVTDQWTPYDTLLLSASDIDQGSGGILLLPDQTGAHTHELVQVGKNGRIEVLDRDNLGGFDETANHVVQEVSGQVGGLWSTPAYWNSNVYIWAANDTLKQFGLKDGLLSTTPAATSTEGSGFPGVSPVISSNGTTNGIVWALRSDGYGWGGPTILEAFDANNVGKLLYSTMYQYWRDHTGGSVKFAVPLVVDGKVFLGTQGEVDVFGLLANAPATVPAVTFSPAPGTYPTAQTVALANTMAGATIYYTTDGTVPTTSSMVYTGPITVQGTTTIQAFAVAAGADNGSIASGNYLIGVAPVLSFSNGFASVAGLTLNGTARNWDDSRLQLTIGGFYQAGSAFSTNPVHVETFISDFTFQLSGVPPMSDGFTFTVQNSKPQALGQYGGGLGYGSWVPNGQQGIPNSVAVKFDMFNNYGEGTDSTGLYVNGASPTTPSVDLSKSGIDLNSGDTMRAHIVYDGTTLFLTITDPVAGGSFTTNFPIDIPGTIGSNTAFVGFTAGTSSLPSSQKILTWNFWSNPPLGPPQPVPTPMVTPSAGLYTTPQVVTVSESLSGSTIHYTVDGTVPTASSPVYTGPMTLANTTMLQVVAVSAGYPNSSTVKGTYLFPSAAEPTLAQQPPPGLSGGGSGNVVPVTGDFNGDGKADVAVINSVASSVSVAFGNGDGSFQAAVNYPVGPLASWLIAGDFNGDGKLDLAVVSGPLGKLTVLLNDGAGGFPAANVSTMAIALGTIHAAVGDFNGDGKVDLALTNGLGGTVTILRGTGTGAFQIGATYPVGNGPGGATVADMNRDGMPDLAVWNVKDNSINVLLNNGSDGFLPAVTYAVGSAPSGIAAGDFNGDGFADVAVSNLSGGTVSVLLNDGTGKLLAPTAYATGKNPMSVTAVDLNGDGVLDLAVTNQGNNTLGLLLGQGDGTFGVQTAVALPLQPYLMAVADFNGDDRMDVAITSYTPPPGPLAIRPAKPVASSRVATPLTVLLQSEGGVKQ